MHHENQVIHKTITIHIFCLRTHQEQVGLKVLYRLHLYLYIPLREFTSFQRAIVHCSVHSKRGRKLCLFPFSPQRDNSTLPLAKFTTHPDYFINWFWKTTIGMEQCYSFCKLMICSIILQAVAIRNLQPS